MWGPINELTTLTAYYALNPPVRPPGAPPAPPQGDPGRARHFAFFRARRGPDGALGGGTPNGEVGDEAPLDAGRSGVKSEEEVDALALYLFGDSPEGHRQIRGSTTRSPPSPARGLTLLVTPSRAERRVASDPAGRDSIPRRPPATATVARAHALARVGRRAADVMPATPRWSAARKSAWTPPQCPRRRDERRWRLRHRSPTLRPSRGRPPHGGAPGESYAAHASRTARSSGRLVINDRRSTPRRSSARPDQALDLGRPLPNAFDPQLAQESLSGIRAHYSRGHRNLAPRGRRRGTPPR